MCTAKSWHENLIQLTGSIERFMSRREFWVPQIKFVVQGLSRDALRAKHKICTCDSSASY